MFNILYRCPRTVARHEHGPLHESRRLYLEHLSASRWRCILALIATHWPIQEKRSRSSIRCLKKTPTILAPGTT